jgi:hypothetical protein
MDITVYLPDEIGKRAKAAEPELNLSRLLRDAVEEELGRRERVELMHGDMQEHEVELESPEGTVYTGVVLGKQLAEEDDGVTVFFTADERVVAYDENRLTLTLVEDAEDFKDAALEVYLAVADALGQKARVEV